MPQTFDSTSINTSAETVPYGLKRNLSHTSSDFKYKSKNTYILVEVNGVKDFIRKDEIYYYDENNVRHELKDLKPEDISNLKGIFYKKDGTEISTIYLEKEFTFNKINAKEELNLTTMTRKTYAEKVNADGSSQFTYKSANLPRTYSEHSFVRKTIG